MGFCGCLFGSFFTLIMILLNIPLVLVGIALIFFGVMTAWYFSTLVSWFHWSFSALSAEDQAAFNNVLQYLDDYALGAGIAMFVFGILLFLIAFLGGFGACCVSTSMMTAYAVLVGVMALGAVVTSIVFLVDSTIIMYPLEQEMLSLVTHNFDDPDNPSRKGNYSDINPQMMAYISYFRILKCCGITNFKDYQKSTKWNRVYEYTPTQKVNEAVVPVMCCKETRKVESTLAGYSYYEPGKDKLDTSCIANPTKENSYIDRTCMASLSSGSTSVLAWFVFGVSIALLILFGVSLYLAIWYKKKERRGNDMHMSTNKYA